jgi:hypothetical protein
MQVKKLFVRWRFRFPALERLELQDTPALVLL